MTTQITNGQKVSASFDLFDTKDKPFEVLPAGTTVVIVSDNVPVAQWLPDADPSAPQRGTITTEGDNVGMATFLGTMTLADGTVKTGSVEIEVIHGPAGEARFTLGTPVEE